MDDPQGYISSNMEQKKDALKLLKEKIGFLKWTPGERVLDIGCGPGDITATVLFPLLPEDATLVGCDISEAMISYCNSSIKNNRMSFKIQDIQHKDIARSFQLESFNKIFSFYCLHWISDQRQAIQNIHSLLKPDGEILLMFVTPDNPIILTMNKLKYKGKWSKFIKDREFFYNCDDPPSFFHDMLQDIGFQNINCHLQKKTCHYASLECLTDLLRAVNPYLKCIPDELKSEYMQDFVDTIIKEGLIKYNDITGELIEEYNLLIVVAQKPNK